jgi:hypothetical protein
MHQQNFYYTTSVRLYCYLGNIIQIIKVFIFFYLRTSEIVGNFNFFFFHLLVSWIQFPICHCNADAKIL